MKLILLTLTVLLLTLTSLVTYSTAVVTGTMLALASAVNYPLLKLLGLINGRKKIQTRT